MIPFWGIQGVSIAWLSLLSCFLQPSAFVSLHAYFVACIFRILLMNPLLGSLYHQHPKLKPLDLLCDWRSRRFLLGRWRALHAYFFVCQGEERTWQACLPCFTCFQGWLVAQRCEFLPKGSRLAAQCLFNMYFTDSSRLRRFKGCKRKQRSVFSLSQ